MKTTSKIFTDHTQTTRENGLATSQRIAGLIGPSLIAIIISELEFVQPHLYDDQIAPVVYLNGTLFFVAGLAIVRAHNRWTLGWQVLITLLGWGAMLGGLFRMFAATSYQQSYQQVASNTTAVFIVQVMLLAVGIVLTFKAYWPTKA